MSTTMIFIVAVLAAGVLFDVWVIWKKGKQSSISAYIIRIFRKYPMVTLGTGIVIGHLAWSMSDFDWMPREMIVEKCKPYFDKPGE